MGWKDTFRKIAENPRRNTLLGTLPFVGAGAYGWWQLLTGEDKSNEYALKLSPLLFAPVYGYIASLLGVRALNRLTYDADTLKRIRECKERVNKRQPPSFASSGETYIDMTVKDAIFQTIKGGDEVSSRKSFAEYGRKNSKPAFLFQAASGYMLAKQYDEGFICLRDAIDLLGGKRPRFNWAYKADWPLYQSSLAMERFFYPDSITNRMLTAALYASQILKNLGTGAHLQKRSAKN